MNWYKHCGIHCWDTLGYMDTLFTHWLALIGIQLVYIVKPAKPSSQHQSPPLLTNILYSNNDNQTDSKRVETTLFEQDVSTDARRYIMWEMYKPRELRAFVSMGLLGNAAGDTAEHTAGDSPAAELDTVGGERFLHNFELQHGDIIVFQRLVSARPLSFILSRIHP